MTAFAVDPDGQVNVAALTNELNFFAQRRLVDGKVTVDRVIDNSLAVEAVRRLGPYRNVAK